MKNNSNTLLTILENQLLISHRTIAEFTKNKISSVQKLITENISELEEFGRLRFEIESGESFTAKQSLQPNYRPEKTYFLNEPQATLLLAFMRNNEIVKIFKIRLVKEFFKMREILSSKTSNEPDLERIQKRTELIEFSERQFSSFEKIFLKIGISEKNELAITSNRAVAKETGIDFIQLAERKGLEAKEKFFTVTELCEIVRNSDQFSNEFKISVSTKDGLKPRPQNLNLLLEFSEFQFRENGEWKLTEKGEDFGKLSQNKSKYSEKTVYHLVWSKSVLENLK
jgi:phage regulator Rha-like protein